MPSVAKFPTDSDRDGGLGTILAPAIPAVRHRVSPEGSGGNIADYAFGRFPEVPKARWRSLVEEGRICWENGDSVALDTRLEAQRTLLISFPADMLARAGVGPFPADLIALHHDDDLIAVHKPPGLLAYPQGLATLSAQQYAERWVQRRDGRTSKLRPLHRLDRETSGVLMYAKNLSADRRIKRAFKARTIGKSYLAVVRGIVEPDVQTVAAAIGPAGADIRVQQGVRADGKPAETVVTVIARGPKHSVVTLAPRTGRTHQIRVHLAHIGHPIVGDKLYTDGGRYFPAHRLEPLTEQAMVVLQLRRHALHAHRITVPTPEGHLDIYAPIPEDIREFAKLHLPQWQHSPGANASGTT